MESFGAVWRWGYDLWGLGETGAVGCPGLDEPVTWRCVPFEAPLHPGFVGFDRGEFYWDPLGALLGGRVGESDFDLVNADGWVPGNASNGHRSSG